MRLPLGHVSMPAGASGQGYLSWRNPSGELGQPAAGSFSSLVVVVSELVGYVVGPLELAKGEGRRHEQV
jgi:hypothetical protein